VDNFLFMYVGFNLNWKSIVQSLAVLHIIHHFRTSVDINMLSSFFSASIYVSSG